LTTATKPAEISRVLPRASPRGITPAIKRALDIGLSAVLLLLWLPLLAVLALLVRISDGGPALYRRRVVGRRGEFDAFKLRTMRTDADEMLRNDSTLRQEFLVKFKLRNDPRVTPIGKFLRRTSLDELPQLWNVLKGEMSLVGPRMVSPVELEKYGAAGWIFNCVRPGMTGYWQVEARQRVSYGERVEMDLFYVNNWSLLWDLRILLKTPARVIRGLGAY
jgi:lipopolysaccharide/colanic/teichoic acid biosynthesis glycosyltransferase